ncbi:30S ribosomal protein S6 [Candidatus Saccharibacteria bacterium]|nr:30S ribosomal protein S6 [Candidatus Saccharibacteria bacterium]
MKQYELTVMIHPDMEVNITPAVDKVKKLISDNGGEIIKETNEGKKHLAYEIDKQEFAVYYYFELNLPADAPSKISNVLNITDEVIRYLLVKVDPRKLKMEARRKAGNNNNDTEADEAEEGNEEE